MDAISPLIEQLAQHQHQISCEQCTLYRLCLPLGLHKEDLATLDTLVERSHQYQAKQALFATNEPFTSLYIVRSGSFKTTISATNGREQVTGFYFPGEFIGLDAIHVSQYQSDAVALESSTVCALPFQHLDHIGDSLPRLQSQLLSKLSKELAGDKNLMMLLGKKTATEKMATYLLSLSKRFGERGFSEHKFRLSMSRSDIANHLGLAVETTSRTLTKFQQQGVISIDGKEIVLLDMAAMQALCG